MIRCLYGMCRLSRSVCCSLISEVVWTVFGNYNSCVIWTGRIFSSITYRRNKKDYRNPYLMLRKIMESDQCPIDIPTPLPPSESPNPSLQRSRMATRTSQQPPFPPIDLKTQSAIRKTSQPRRISVSGSLGVQSCPIRRLEAFVILQAISLSNVGIIESWVLRDTCFNRPMLSLCSSFCCVVFLSNGLCQFFLARPVRTTFLQRLGFLKAIMGIGRGKWEGGIRAGFDVRAGDGGGECLVV